MKKLFSCPLILLLILMFTGCNTVSIEPPTIKIVKTSSDGFILQIPYHDCHGYGIKEIAPDAKISHGEIDQNLNYSLGQYCFRVMLYDTQNDYSNTYWEINEIPCDGYTLKFMCFPNCDHGFEIVVGSDKPLNFPLGDHNLSNSLNGTESIRVTVAN